jgi:MFS transporter, SHS family, lactate transporter
MTKELHLSAAAVGWPLAFSNGLTLLFSFLWGTLADGIGRRWAMIIPATMGIAVAPLYLLTSDYTTIAIAFSIQGAFCRGNLRHQSERERTFPIFSGNPTCRSRRSLNI